MKLQQPTNHCTVLQPTRYSNDNKYYRFTLLKLRVEAIFYSKEA